MSIRVVLFSGIIALLLVMAGSQMALVYGFNQRLTEEISSQSTALTKVVLQMTAEKLQTVEPHAATPAADSQQSKTVQREVKVIELEGDSAMRHSDLHAELQHQLHQLTRDDSAPQLKAWHIKTDAAVNPLVADVMRYTLLLIAISTLLAMVLALMLAHRFVRPLEQLVAGFRRLQQGELGHTVPLQGLREYRYVAQQFNTMSQRLQQLAAQAEQAQQQQHLAELGEISRGMVHALRNPIHTLSLLLERVAASDDAALRQQLADSAEQKMRQINRHLTALLTLSCADIQRQQQVSIRTLLQDLMLEFSGAGVQFDIDPAADFTVLGAEAELRAIVQAVLSNAVEASQAGDRIRLQIAAQQRQLCIADQGPGLSDSIAAQLFSPHCSSKPEGAGMGLYIARRLLQRYYQGDISLQNLPGGGCLACISFNPETDV